MWTKRLVVVRSEGERHCVLATTSIRSSLVNPSPVIGSLPSWSMSEHREKDKRPRHQYDFSPIPSHTPPHLRPTNVLFDQLLLVNVSRLGNHRVDRRCAGDCFECKDDANREFQHTNNAV